jgi:multiple sugar transport system substrate-binding protein
MKRGISLGTILDPRVIAAVFLLGSAQIASAEQKVITFWKAPHSAHEKELWASIIADFEAKNPNVKIEHTITPWNTWNEQYTAAYASGEPPCVAYMVDAFAPSFVFNDKFVDLDKAGLSAEVSAGYGPLWKVANFGGIQAGIPFATAPRMWLYNKTLFDKAKVAYPTDSWTMDDFVRIAKDLKKGGVSIPANIPVGTTEGFGAQSYLPFLWSMGGDILTPDGKSARVNDKPSIDTIKWLKGLLAEGVIAPIGQYAAQEGQDLFMRGGLGMEDFASEVLGKIKHDTPDLKFGVVRAPAGPGGQFDFEDWGYFAIAKECKAQKEAWEFEKFITSKDIVEKYVGAVGLFPARTDTNLYKDDPIAQAYLANETHNKNIPIVPKTNRIMDVWITGVVAGLAGMATPEKAMEEAQSSLTKVLQGD